MHDQKNYNIPIMNIKNLYVNEIMNWIRYNGNFQSILARMNSFLVATLEDFKIYPRQSPRATSIWNIDNNHRAFIAGTQQSNIEKVDDIGQKSKASILPIDMEEVRTFYPMVILR